VKLIVGLGNPGDIYSDSRHNIGFSVVKALAKTHKISLKKERWLHALSAKSKICGQDVVLALPLTFMNLSGSAVSALLKKYKIEITDLLAISDDLDLELGRMKLKSCGSSGGHKGLNSIINTIHTDNFARLRLGIGRPHYRNIDTSEYVLSPFAKKEKEEVRVMIEEACECCEVWLAQGITKTMNSFNKRSKENE